MENLRREIKVIKTNLAGLSKIKRKMKREEGTIFYSAKESEIQGGNNCNEHSSKANRERIIYRWHVNSIKHWDVTNRSNHGTSICIVIYK